MKSVKVRVHGRVQGVYYRSTARAEGERLGLVGWVRNMDDGTVLLQAQGDPTAIDSLLEWCRVGPPGADVAWLDAEDVDPDDSLTSFRVR